MSQRAFGAKLFLKQLFRFVESLFVPLWIIHQGTKHRFDGGLSKQCNLLQQASGGDDVWISGRFDIPSPYQCYKNLIVKQPPDEARAKA